MMDLDSSNLVFSDTSICIHSCHMESRFRPRVSYSFIPDRSWLANGVFGGRHLAGRSPCSRPIPRRGGSLAEYLHNMETSRRTPWVVQHQVGEIAKYHLEIWKFFRAIN